MSSLLLLDVYGNFKSIPWRQSRISRKNNGKKLFREAFTMNKVTLLIARAVISDTRHLQFESSHGQIFVYYQFCLL